MRPQVRDMGPTSRGASTTVGTPAGDIYDIAWARWGAKTATGEGRVATFKPKGGYYRTPVRVELRATDLGAALPIGPLAYRRSNERAQSKPGGPIGPWGGSFNVCINPNPESASPSTTVPPASSTSPAGGTSCTSSNLSVSLGEGSGATGTVYYPLTFTNTGATNCTLAGYPGISLVGSHGNPIGSPREVPRPVLYAVTRTTGQQYPALFLPCGPDGKSTQTPVVRVGGGRGSFWV